MMADAPIWPDDEAAAISRALVAEGGHLFVHVGGYTLSYDSGCTCGYVVEPIRKACIAAGLPVIDTRALSFDEAMQLAIDTPIVAVGVPADVGRWDGCALAPLWHVAALYHAAGAMVLNMPAVTAARAGTAA